MLVEFIAPNKDETPAKCNEKIERSTAGPEWDWMLANGGYLFYWYWILFF